MNDWIARLPGFFQATELLGCAAQLAADARFSVAHLANLLGVEADAIEAQRRVERARREAERAEDLARIDRVAADDLTAMLLRMFVEHLSAPAGAEAPRFSQRPLRLQVRAFDRIFELHLPHAAGALAGVYEIFVRENYALPPAVGQPPVIFDLGANLGLATLYLHARFPGAALVCIEPAEENLAFLRQNLHANGIDARVLPVALAAAAGTAELALSDVVLMHSTTFGATAATPMRGQRTVATLPLDAIVEGEGFGLKIDVEGAEFALLDCPAPIARAAWVLGEIHCGDFVTPERFRRLEHVFASSCNVETSAPRITDRIAARDFKALR